MPEARPVVLSISGHDPSGGAGIQADIETIAAIGCYPCTVITALTLQDTKNIKALIPQPGKQIRDQLQLLINDIDIQSIKIGLVGSIEGVDVIYSFLKENDHIPVVLDPVLSAGGGYNASSRDLIRTITSKLIPLSTMVLPNCREARQLSQQFYTLDECGKHLQSFGCEHILITGADENTPKVVNRLYSRSKLTRSFCWDRLAASYHGSGCTLASAAAAFLALGLEPANAVFEAQNFTWKSLNAGFKPGKGQNIPDRLHRCRR